MKTDCITVLCVDDHKDTLTSLEHILKLHGYTVWTAENASAAITLGKSISFDILLCDIGLPDGPGWHVLNELRSLKLFPAVALSGYCMKEEREEQRRNGFDECIAKPYSILTILAAIEKYTSFSANHYSALASNDSSL